MSSQRYSLRAVNEIHCQLLAFTAEKKKAENKRKRLTPDSKAITVTHIRSWVVLMVGDHAVT
eukprot:m.181514 g.181514  ORF g.181514 m.181514 type:complete len:62 (+) comp39276_c0_seq1:679-864(+)